MSNTTLAALVPKVITKSLMVLRQSCYMPRLVNSDYSATAVAQKGSVIDVPIPTAMSATAVSPSSTPTSPTALSEYSVQLPLNQWYTTNFHLTDKEAGEIDADANFKPMQMQEAIKALANQINTSIMQEAYLNAYYTCGKAGTVPFGTAYTTSGGGTTLPTRGGSTDDAIIARALLNTALAPRDNRRGVLNYDAEGAALALAAFRDASQSGKDAPIIQGEVGRFFGIDWYTDDHVQSFSSNAYSAGAMTINGVQAAGAGTSDGGRTGTISIAKASGTNWSAKAGDVIAFLVTGSGWQYHVVTAATTVTQSANTTVPVAPALKVATAGAEAILVLTNSTPAASGAATTSVQNLVFHRDAIAFATRPMQQGGMTETLGNIVMSVPDPVTGLTLRLEVSRQTKQTLWEFDILWGVKAVRPEHIVRLLG